MQLGIINAIKNNLFSILILEIILEIVMNYLKAVK